MPTSVDDIEAAALELPADERARLAQRLFASLDREPVEAAWDAEIRRRIDEFEAGRIDTIPAEKVFAEPRRRLNG
jgi:putative addiction module component (TIGR02574 family)